MSTDYSAIYRASYRLFAHVECIRVSWRPGENLFYRLWIPDADVREMEKQGGFTKENVLRWVEQYPSPDPIHAQPLVDFRAACGNIELPWANDESRLAWEEEAKHSPMGVTREEVEAWNRGVSLQT